MGGLTSTALCQCWRKVRQRPLSFCYRGKCTLASFYIFKPVTNIFGVKDVAMVQRHFTLMVDMEENAAWNSCPKSDSYPQSSSDSELVNVELPHVTSPMMTSQTTELHMQSQSNESCITGNLHHQHVNKQTRNTHRAIRSLQVQYSLLLHRLL